MPSAKTTAILGAVAFAAGLVLFVYVGFFAAPYPGASGAGMAGLPGAMQMLAALAMMAVGAPVTLVSMLVHVIRRRVEATATTKGDEGRA